MRNSSSQDPLAGLTVPSPSATFYAKPSRPLLPGSTRQRKQINIFEGLVTRVKPLISPSRKSQPASAVHDRVQGLEERVRRLQKELAELRGRYSHDLGAVRASVKGLQRRLEEHLCQQGQQDHSKSQISLGDVWHRKEGGSFAQSESFLKSPLIAELRKSESPLPSPQRAILGDSTLRERAAVTPALPNISTPTFQAFRHSFHTPEVKSIPRRKGSTPVVESQQHRHKQAQSWEVSGGRLLSQNVSFHTEGVPVGSPPNRFLLSIKPVQPLRKEEVEINETPLLVETPPPLQQLKEARSNSDRNTFNLEEQDMSLRPSLTEGEGSDDAVAVVDLPLGSPPTERGEAEVAETSRKSPISTVYTQRLWRSPKRPKLMNQLNRDLKGAGGSRSDKLNHSMPGRPNWTHSQVSHFSPLHQGPLDFHEESARSEAGSSPRDAVPETLLSWRGARPTEESKDIIDESRVGGGGGGSWAGGDEVGNEAAEEGRVRALKCMTRHDSLSPGKHPHSARSHPAHLSFDSSSPQLFGASPLTFLQSSARRGFVHKVPPCECKPAVQRRPESRGDDKSSLHALNTEGTDEPSPQLEPTRPRSILSQPGAAGSPTLPCGDYCVNVPARRQRALMRRVDSGQNSGPSSVRNKRFLVSANWWRCWKEYVEFDVDPGSAASPEDTTARRSEGGGEGYTEMIRTLQAKRPRGEALFQEYEHPGPISNLGLLVPHSRVELRRPLLEHYDFEAVSPGAWRYLKAWYGCDVAVARLLVRDHSDPTTLVLDLYPFHRQKRSHLSQGSSSFL